MMEQTTERMTKRMMEQMMERMTEQMMEQMMERMIKQTGGVEKFKGRSPCRVPLKLISLTRLSSAANA
jgi:hypothetical protein